MSTEAPISGPPSDDAADLEVSEFRRKKREVLRNLLALTFLFGGLHALITEGSTAGRACDLIYAVALGGLCCQWSYFDGLLRGRISGKFLRVTTILIPPLGMTIYLLHSRRLRGLLSLAKGVVFFVLMLALSYASGRIFELIRSVRE
jgi:hypothetical protein